MREPQGVASLALGYVLHWAFSPPLLNQYVKLYVMYVLALSDYKQIIYNLLLPRVKNPPPN